jgi:hypothetical protein
MEEKLAYDTVSAAVNDLIRRGYSCDFNINPDQDVLVCSQNSKSLSPEEFKIDEVYRFEGETDPGDEMIVYAISSESQDMKGVLVNGYGIYADGATSKVVKYLDTQTQHENK